MERFCAVHTGSPESAALWVGKSPQGHRSSGWYGVTHSVCSIALARRSTADDGSSNAGNDPPGTSLYPVGVPSALRGARAHHLPAALGCPVVVLLALRLGAQRGLAQPQAEPVRVVRPGGRGLRLDRVHRVVPAVHVEVEPGHDEVLVERRVGAVVHQRAVRRLLAGREVRGDHDPGRADLALDVAVLVEAPVDQVLVVRHGDVEGHHQPPGAAHLRAELVVHVLPQHAVVLFVDADGVRDELGLARRVVHHRVEVGDLAEAVAAAFERGGHEAEPPLADVERGPPEVVGGRIPVGHHHLRERQPVRDRPQPCRRRGTRPCAGPGLRGS